MMKKLLVFILFCAFNYSNSQNVFSFKFNNINLPEVLAKIENKTKYKFYYQKKWFTTDSIYKNYENQSLNTILEDLFDKTLINFLIIENEKRIILTQNIIIHNSLPQGYFGDSNGGVDDNKGKTPVIFNNYSSNTKKNKVVKIGKETINDSNKFYTISGYVKNINTGKSISNLVLSVNNGKTYSTTNDKGFYSLKLHKGKNTIETKSLGIKKSITNVIVYGNGKLNFNLYEDSETLNEISISANKDINVKKEITGLTQIKVKEIKTIPLVLGERDIFKVATTLPGVKKAGEGASGLNVRGGKTDQNLILLDDGLLYNPTHFFGIFSAFNPFTTESLDIYKGGIPSEYGGRLSSVFDVKVKNGNMKKITGEGSIGPVTSNIAIELPISKNKSSLILGGRSTYSNWILKKLKNKQLKNSKASFYDAIIKYHHNFDENNSIEALGYYSKDNFSITKDSLYDYSNRLISLKWKKRFNKKNDAKIVLTNTNYNFNINYKGTPKEKFNLGYNIEETELKLKLQYIPNTKYKFKYGISSKLYFVSPGIKEPQGKESSIKKIEIPKEKGLESAVYLSGNFQINDKLSFDTGIRYSSFIALGESTQKVFKPQVPRSNETVINTLSFENYEPIKTYGGPEIRLATRYLIKPNFSLKASYNSMYQYIHTLSNNTTASPTDTWKLSDYNIKPQFSNQFSLGLYKNFNGNMYEVSIESYYKNTKNILDYKTGSELFLNNSIETSVLQGIGKSYGIEFLLSKKSGKLNGWLSYSFSRSFISFNSNFETERINNGVFFPDNFDKPHDLSLISNYKLTKRYSLSLNFNYQTGRPVTYPVNKYLFNGAEYVTYSDRNKFRIPDYYRLDLGINIEGNHKIKKLAHSFWNISIYNVLGKNNPYSVFFVTEDNQIKGYKSSIFSVPIPTITYNFRF